MSRWMGVAALFGFALAAWPGGAVAEVWSLHATGIASGGYTDNVESLPQGHSDLFYEVAPGALFTLESPRTIHELTYEFRYTGYGSHTEANSYSNQGSWRGLFLLSPRTEIAMLATVRQGQTNTFRPTDGTISVDLLPAGADFFTLESSETLRHQLNPNWRLTQTASASHTSTTVPGADPGTDTTTDGLDLGATMGADRSWKRDGVGLTLGVDYIVLTQPDASSHQINTSADLAWRRDLSLHWTSMVRGGVTGIFPIQQAAGDATSSMVEPTISGILAWFPNWGSLRLEAQRMVAVNMFLAQNTVADEATLTGWLPVPYFVEDPLAPILTISSGIGIRRAQLVDLSSNQREVANSYSADVALHYSPHRSAFGVTLRYTFNHQTQDAATVDPALAQFTRNAIMLEVHGRWPERQAATFPNRAPLRVDGTDITPLPAEQAAAPPPRPQQ